MKLIESNNMSLSVKLIQSNKMLDSMALQNVYDALWGLL